MYESCPLTIAQNLYLNGEKITDLTITSDIPVVKYRTFQGYKSLKYLYIDTKAEKAFPACTGLQTIVIGEHATINNVSGNDTFEDCSGVKNIYIQRDIWTPTSQFCKGSSATVHVYSDKLLDYQTNTVWNEFTLTDDFDNPSAGCLSTIVGTNPTALKVSGDLNGTDIKYLRSLVSNHFLSSIDMSGANIVSGGDAYYTSGTTSYTTVANAIGSRMFINLKNIVSVKLPTNIIRINEFAFQGCSNLESVTIPDGVTNISYYVFQSCNKLKEVILPTSLTSLGDGAFLSSGIESIFIPANVTAIGIRPFGLCKSLTSLTVDTNNNKFVAMDNVLYSIDKTKIIQYLSTKTDLDFSIPEGVTTIGGLAFDGSALETLILPSTISTIADNAFRDNSKLKTITCKATTIPTISANTFKSVDKTIPLKVPYSSLSSYRVTDYWKEFTNISSIEGYASKLSLSQTEADVAINHSITLTAIADVSDCNFVWSSSDETIATVNEGVVTALKTGTVTITAKVNDVVGISATCTLTIFKNNGDVTGDGNITSADVTACLKFVLGDDTMGLNATTADFNGDGEYTVSDAIAIVRLALSGSTEISAKRRAAKAKVENVSDALDISDVEMAHNSTSEVSVNFADKTDKIVSFQFDMVLPDGITLAGVSAGSKAVDHSFTYINREEGFIRVFCYSLSNSTFNTGEGDVVKLTLKADDDIMIGDYDIDINNIELVHTDLSTVRSDAKKVSVSVFDPTDIVGVSAGNITFSVSDGGIDIVSANGGIANIYTSDGKLVYKNNLAVGEHVTISVPAGVYIVNGKKVLVK